jgi:hypothetical protein
MPTPDGHSLHDLADEIERRADADRRRLQRLERRDGDDRDEDAVVALTAELALLRRAADATDQLLRRRLNR